MVKSIIPFLTAVGGDLDVYGNSSPVNGEDVHVAIKPANQQLIDLKDVIDGECGDIKEPENCQSTECMWVPEDSPFIGDSGKGCKKGPKVKCADDVKIGINKKNECGKKLHGEREVQGHGCYVTEEDKDLIEKGSFSNTYDAYTIEKAKNSLSDAQNQKEAFIVERDGQKFYWSFYVCISTAPPGINGGDVSGGGDGASKEGNNGGPNVSGGEEGDGASKEGGINGGNGECKRPTSESISIPPNVNFSSLPEFISDTQVRSDLCKTGFIGTLGLTCANGVYTVVGGEGSCQKEERFKGNACLLVVQKNCSDSETTRLNKVKAWPFNANGQLIMSKEDYKWIKGIGASRISVYGKPECKVTFTKNDDGESVFNSVVLQAGIYYTVNFCIWPKGFNDAFMLFMLGSKISVNRKCEEKNCITETGETGTCVFSPSEEGLEHPTGTCERDFAETELGLGKQDISEYCFNRKNCKDELYCSKRRHNTCQAKYKLNQRCYADDGENCAGNLICRKGSWFSSYWCYAAAICDQGQSDCYCGTGENSAWCSSRYKCTNHKSAVGTCS